MFIKNYWYKQLENVFLDIFWCFIEEGNQVYGLFLAQWKFREYQNYGVFVTNTGYFIDVFSQSMIQWVFPWSEVSSPLFHFKIHQKLIELWRVWWWWFHGIKSEYFHKSPHICFNSLLELIWFIVRCSNMFSY